MCIDCCLFGVIETPWTVTKGRKMKYPAMIPRICSWIYIFNAMIERTRKEVVETFRRKQKNEVDCFKGNSSSFSLSIFPPLISISFVFYSYNPFLSIFISRFSFSTKLQGAHRAQCDGKCMEHFLYGFGVEIVAFFLLF